MNNLVKKIVAGTMVAVLSIGVVLGSNLSTKSVEADENNDVRVISVSGEAKIKVTPDIAYLTVGVQTEAKTAEEAKNLNASKMNKVVAALKNAGIASADLKTSNFSIYPRYEWITPLNSVTKEQQRTLVGYQVNNSLDVKVRNIDKVSEVIDVATKNGANNTNNVRFGLVDQTKYYNEALIEAVQNAKGKANAIAGAINVRLDKPAKVSEESYGGTFERYSNVMMKAEAAMDAVESTPIEAGELEITARVNVEYNY